LRYSSTHTILNAKVERNSKRYQATEARFLKLMVTSLTLLHL